MIETSGHVPGHQSVLVRLQAQSFLLAIDAIPSAIHRDPDARPVTRVDMDEQSVRTSTRKLVELAAGENATLIYGHDAAQWRTLRQLPERY